MASQQDPNNTSDDPQQPIQRYVDILVHVGTCKSLNCDRLADCCRMKQVLEHVKECPRKTSGGCRVCIKFMNICCYHAQKCQQEDCAMQYCQAIKLRLRQKNEEGGDR